MNRLHKDTIIYRHVDRYNDGEIMNEFLWKYTKTKLVGEVAGIEIRTYYDENGRGCFAIVKDKVVISYYCRKLSENDITELKNQIENSFLNEKVIRIIENEIIPNTKELYNRKKSEGEKI